jgi:hypothetical protein
MATPTYIPIATNTLSSATNVVTFSSIPGTYKNIVLVVNSGSVSVGGQCKLTFNNDTGTNYSFTFIEGQNGTAPNAMSNGRSANVAAIPISSFEVGPDSIPNTYIANIQSYSNTSTYKTLFARSNIKERSGYSAVTSIVGMWRSTAAITRIDATHSSSNFPIGSVFTIYGIL